MSELERFPDAARRLALVVLRSDAVFAGRAWPIAATLEDELELVPLALRCLWLGPSRLERLYQRALGKLGPTVWLHREVARLAPAAVLLYTGPTAGYPSLAERLDAIKGASLSIADEDRTPLRSRYGRTSSFHALIHTAADPGAVVDEAQLFFTDEVLKAALSSAKEGAGDIAVTAVRQRPCREILLRGGPTPADTVFLALLNLQRRIAAALVLDSPAEAEPGWRARFDRLSEAEVAVRAATSYREQRNAFSNFRDRESNGLAALIRAEETRLLAELPAAFERSASPSVAPAASAWARTRTIVDRLQLARAGALLSGVALRHVVDEHDLFALLDRTNVPLTAWERSMIWAGLAADVNPDAGWEGERLFPNGW